MFLCLLMFYLCNFCHFIFFLFFCVFFLSVLPLAVVGGTIQCRNTKCVKTATGLEARREFKVCHNCNAYYCSRECRRAHWEKHKKTCMQSRVGAICKQIISHVKEDSYVMNQLSTTAKRGFLAKGRGSVKLFFNSPDRAERFLTGGLPELPEPL